MSSTEQRPWLGFGLGLRPDHYPHIIEHKPDVDWFEILSENYLVPGGKPLVHLDKIRADYPMVMHGVSMSIGSTDPLDYDYLKDLKALIDHVQPEWVSDHLCWTGVHGTNMHDLLPMPYTEEAAEHIAAKIREVQDYLDRRILIENVSSYLTYKQSEMTEWEFYNLVIEKADALMLLDVNNIYVSGFNHQFDPKEYIDSVDPARVWQHHLAGHTNHGEYIIDTHDHPIIDPVWELYEYTVAKLGPVSTMIERDDNIPPFEELYDELQVAKGIAQKVQEQMA